jgi:hypothetical protein
VPAGETHEYVPLPSDWNGGRAIRRNCTDMEYMTPEQMDVAVYQNACENAKVGYYTIENQRVRLLPAAPENTTIDLLYWSKITPLDDTNTTNWLIETHPTLYLFGALLYAGLYIKSDEDMQRISAMYQAAFDDLTTDSNEKLYGGGTLRARMG